MTRMIDGGVRRCIAEKGCGLAFSVFCHQSPKLWRPKNKNNQLHTKISLITVLEVRNVILYDF